MHPHFSSMLATLLVVIGGVTVLIMLEMTGKVRDSPRRKGWILVHRVLGYLFLVLFAAMLVFMVIKAGGFQEELPARAMIHIILALLLVPLIMIKVVIARRHAQLSTKLIMLGLAIFGLSFGLTGITAGYYALHRSDFKYSVLSDVDDEILNVEIGQKITNRKCSKCHSLERVYQSYKSDVAWTHTIHKMAELDYPNITNFDVKQIVGYLVQQQQKRQGEEKDKLRMEIGRSLVSQKCSICHNLDRIFGAKKSRQEWTETVGRMTKTNGDADFLTDQEAVDIIYFLTNIRQSGQPEKPPEKKVAENPPDAIKALVALKCSAGCHALDRVLRVHKDETQWLETVNSMVEITGDPNFLTPQEKKDIIHFLSTRKPSKSSRMGALHPDISENVDPLLDNKCNVCHDLERIQRVERNKEEWTDIVNSMVESTGDPNYLSSQEKDKIINIISTWGSQEQKEGEPKEE
ncbi:Quinohemoprotein amine dehydrogenase A, alpha subunit, heme binding [Candidatus Electrothrix marina]|uniref:Quinohemoprotein amine dehydrogenase A, alpha subunit, heme binding n=1 Tax=Candidatus Electrothrix marina TaxID=1859130 RepID=A0A444JFG0_9BACT|nr:Quinohemoprotein amine dehydrogenase A, alpha subunit, heme binding [Candidatus Electrothrix marina]